MRVLIIGAHLDDGEFYAGGAALKYIESGHEVCFLSLCNGSGGHHILSASEIAKRRKKEADAVTKLTGIKYKIWEDVEDCTLMANLENRERLVRYIREYKPDIIFTHRTNDYHADHRNAALLVQDASYLLIVPNYCPDVPSMAEMPVIMYFYDEFMNPPFMADVMVPTDSVIDRKYEMMNCHVSQFYEWLPYTNGLLDEVPEDPEERLEWLRQPRMPRDGSVTEEKFRQEVEKKYGDINRFITNSTSEYREAAAAMKYRKKLNEAYGEENKVIFAEAFQVSEYGSALTEKSKKELFPF